jgi:hypothetical protein
MYKTLIQLVLFFILIFIIFIIFNKYFLNEKKIEVSKNTTSLNSKIDNLSSKNIEKKNINNEIVNLVYEKFDTNGNKYLIKAKKGILDRKRPNIIYMNMVEASFIYSNNEKLIINSEEAIFNKENFKTTFSKNVKLIYKKQILKSDNLDFLINKNIAIFKDNVKYYNQDIEAFADIVVVNLLTKEIDIKSNNQKRIKIKKKN